jgi:hypothetical protein
VSRTDALQISPYNAGAVLTPAQKRFSALIRQIEKARKTLATWEEMTQNYRQEHHKVLRPLVEALMAGNRTWLFALDALHDGRNWTRDELDTLSELLCDEARTLLDRRDDDEEIKALFNKHSEVDYETEQREMMRTMKGLTAAFTGLDLGDDEGIDTDADLMERVQQGMQARMEADSADTDDAGERSAKTAKRPKQAAQLQREAQAKQATQSIREIYRKLASALHPDRETDAQLRKEKTAMMQSVNQAYSANDLLTLLELQLQIEQIDASHIANTSAERLKHYNQVLADQLAEINAQADRVATEFEMDFDLPVDWITKPRKMSQLLEQTSDELQAELAQQQRKLQMLGNMTATRRWLKRERKLQRQADYYYDPY